MFRDFIRKLAFVPVFLSGVCAVNMAHATALNYHWLFRFVLVLTLIHLGLAALYFRFVSGWLRWLVLAVSLLVLLSLAELGLRVYGLSCRASRLPVPARGGLTRGLHHALAAEL